MSATMTRQARIDQQAALADTLTELLSRFPEKPRGAMCSRADAARTAQEKISSASDALQGLQQAVAAVKSLADSHAYDTPYTAGRQAAPRRTAVFVYDEGGIEETLLRKIGEHFTESGKGSRTDIEALTRMVRCFIEFDRGGLALPVSTVLPAHLQYPAFIAALNADGVLQTVGRSEERIASADKGTRGRIQQAARHRLETAGALFNAVVDDMQRR
ncbi:hypothetical protein [Undibacterium griseum]|uniref:Uncharacterized protein n=1 Tax=Undibacterium griseum TaxID=2762295 RepID=A0ABR6YQZ3_9BURK|nr:hypothetical protein [Undibacterium griseum]MBC3886316.1 hypothetical protein [Undibacterium griseum]